MTTDPILLVIFQLMDGFTGATLGVLTTLIIADLTNGTGRFNLAQGLAGTFSGGGIMVFLAAEKLIYRNDIIAEHGPLMLAGGLILLAGMMMFCTGLIGEMMMRTYFESQDRRIYAVREILTRKQRGVPGGAR